MTPRAPRGLKAAGRSLFRAIAGGLPAAWEFDERELELLGLAAHQADQLATLEKAIADRGTFILGSAGQPVLNPAIAEARMARVTVSRLLGALQLPDGEEEQPRSAAGQRARRAARARWDRREQVRQQREAARGAA